MNPAERFQQFYQSELHPLLGELEATRKQVMTRAILRALITGVSIIAIGLTIGLNTPMAALGVVLPFAGVALAMYIFLKSTEGYVAKFKQNVIGRIVQFVDPGLSYNKDGCIPESVFRGSQIFPTPHRYRGEDLVWGKIGQTAMQFSEVVAENQTHSRDRDGHTKEEWETFFQGIFFVANFNKHFQGVTVVRPDFTEKLFGRMGQKLQALIPGRGQLVQLEDVEFEKHFVVYADDQIEARYLLSPSLMARILGYVKRTGRIIQISFVSSHVCLAIHYDKPLFEPRLFKSVHDMNLAKEYLDDMMLAVSLVEELNLNTRIWSKQ